MKHFIIIITIILFAIISNVALAQNVSCNWVQQNSGTTNVLYTCKAVNENICWAGGAGATVRRTTNGGANWLNANPNPGVISGTIYNMEAIDGNTAWVTTETTTSTTVYKTSNGGINWAVVYSNTTGFIKGIRMLDSMNGIAIGDPINTQWNLLLTSDGGNTWFDSPNQPTASNIHQGTHNSFQVDMPNIYWGTSFTSIFRSTNGGVTFDEISTPGGGIYIFSLLVNPSGVGFAAGTGMSRTTDGGATFQSYTVPGAGNIDAINSFLNNFWYVRGTKVYLSSNNGASWTETYTAPQSIFHMDIPENNGLMVGWAVGIGGNIYHMDCITVGITNTSTEIPEKYSLSQNYPNPFNPTTKIDFELPVGSGVKISIYDNAGRMVKGINEGNLSPGKYQYEFNGENLSSGVYFCRLESGDFMAIRKMVLMK